MGFLKILAGFIVIVVLLMAGLYGWLGGFAPVKPEKGHRAASDIYYMAYQGPYGSLGKVWAGFAAQIEEAGLPECDALGLYLDPPETPPEETRSVLACHMDRLTAQERQVAAEKFAVFTLPRMEVLYADFPFRNDLSYIVGPVKVYPVLSASLEKSGITPPLTIEEYGPETGRETLRFVLPVDRTRGDYAALVAAF